MFKELKQHWTQFRKYPQGERFERYYRVRHESPQGLLKKALLISVGIVIMAAGVIFLAIPGPGLLVMLVGAALIARESLFVSRLFDRLEPHLWKFARWCRQIWQALSPGAKTLLLVTTLLLATATLFGAYAILF